MRDRIKAVLLKSEGWADTQIAQALRLHEETIRQHLKDWSNESKLRPENGGSKSKLTIAQTQALKAHLDELEKMVQDDDGKPIDIDAMDDAAIQAKVKEIEESMHAVSTKLYEAAAAEMAQQESGEDGDISVDDGVVDADFEVVEDED